MSITWAQGDNGEARDDDTIQLSHSEPQPPSCLNTKPDATLTELRVLRDMVVEQKVDVRNMEARMMEGQSLVEELRREVENQRVELSITQTQLQFYKDKLSATERHIEEFKKNNAGNI